MTALPGVRSRGARGLRGRNRPGAAADRFRRCCRNHDLPPRVVPRGAGHARRPGRPGRADHGRSAGELAAHGSPVLSSGLAKYADGPAGLSMPRGAHRPRAASASPSRPVRGAARPGAVPADRAAPRSLGRSRPVRPAAAGTAGSGSRSRSCNPVARRVPVATRPTREAARPTNSPAVTGCYVPPAMTSLPEHARGRRRGQVRVQPPRLISCSGGTIGFAVRDLAPCPRN